MQDNLKRSSLISIKFGTLIGPRHWVTLTFDLAFRSAIRWAKPKAER